MPTDEGRVFPSRTTHLTEAEIAKRKRRDAERKNRRSPTVGRPGDIKAVLKELNVHKPSQSVTAADRHKFEKLKNELRLTYSAVADRFDNWKHFSERHFRFAQQYARNGRRFAMKAMLAAGFQANSEKALTTAVERALKLDGMEELIAAFEFEEKARMKLNIEDVVQWFQKIATAAMEAGDFTNANRSLENLGKYLGMFVEKKEITHKVVHNKQELDSRIQELTTILKEAEPDIEARLRIY